MKRVEIERRLERISSFVNKAMIAVAQDMTAVALTGVPVGTDPKKSLNFNKY